MRNDERATPIGGPDAYYRAELAKGRILLQRSRRSGECFFYPRVCVPRSGDIDFEWIEATGDGIVYSTTVVRRRPEQGGDYNLALVTLDEGPRLLSQVTGIEPDLVSIGLQVTALVGGIDGEPVILFEAAAGRQS